MSLLEVSGLRKKYKARTVVRDVEFEVAPGEVVGLLGPNGAGKTTCFYMIVGLVRCDAGTIRLDGAELTHLPIHRRARMGLSYLPQEMSVFRRLTVADNVRAVLELQEGQDAAKLEERLEGLLEDLGIAHLADSMAVSLSGVLITDHNVRETLGICDHAYIISEGEVLARGRPDEIIEDERVRRVYLGEHFRL